MGRAVTTAVRPQLVKTEGPGRLYSGVWCASLAVRPSRVHLSSMWLRLTSYTEDHVAQSPMYSATLFDCNLDTSGYCGYWQGGHPGHSDQPGGVLLPVQPAAGCSCGAEARAGRHRGGRGAGVAHRGAARQRQPRRGLVGRHGQRPGYQPHLASTRPALIWFYLRALEHNHLRRPWKVPLAGSGCSSSLRDPWVLVLAALRMSCR